MTILNTPTDVGPVIREARTAKGWTQRELADRCAIKASYIMLIENGRRGEHTSMWVICTILAQLDLSLAVQPMQSVSEEAKAALVAALLEG